MMTLVFVTMMLVWYMATTKFTARRLARVAAAILMVLSLSTIASAQAPRAIPAGVDLVKYPILDHRLTVAEIGQYGLRPTKLEHDVIVHNYVRGDRAFRLDTLRVGELVLVDQTGNPVYKESCGNRIAVVEDCPKCDPTPQPAITPQTPPATGSDKAAGPGFWSRLFGGLGSALGALLSLLGWLLLIALILAALMLAVWGLWRLAQAIEDNLNRRRAIGPVPPTPPQPPVPPVVPPVPPVVGPIPVQTTTTRRYGPFQTIGVSDRQADGYHVTGDGRPIGVFLDPVRTEDAGIRGHYIVVTTVV